MHPVRLYILREGKWRDFDNWPPAGSTPTEYFLHSEGRANSIFGDGSLDTTSPEDELPDVYTYDPVGPQPGHGGHSCCFEDVAPMGPADQYHREVNNGVLVYTSAPLTEPLWLIGDVSATIYAATTAVDTDYAVRLCVVDENGVSTNLQEGIVRARYRESLSNPSLLEPGEIYRYEIPIGPVGVKLDAGERMRVQVTSNDFPQWDRNLNTGNSPGSEGLAERDRGDTGDLSRRRTPVEHHAADLGACKLMRARSLLSVPGGNARMIEKALATDADMVMLDLEDATAPSQKAEARQVVIDAVNGSDWRGRPKTFRCNGFDTQWMYRDVVEVVQGTECGVDRIVLPKTSSAADVSRHLDSASPDGNGIRSSRPRPARCSDRIGRWRGALRSHCGVGSPARRAHVRPGRLCRLSRLSAGRHRTGRSVGCGICRKSLALPDEPHVYCRTCGRVARDRWPVCGVP